MTLALFQNGAIRHVAGKKVAIARTDTLDDPGAVQRWADAVRRGAACTVDVMAGVDHFALATRDSPELREEFAIPAKAVPLDGEFRSVAHRQVDVVGLVDELRAPVAVDEQRPDQVEETGAEGIDVRVGVSPLATAGVARPARRPSWRS